MNIYILLSILFVTLLFVILKWFEHVHVDGFSAIVFNYFAAAAFAFFVGYNQNMAQLSYLPHCFIVGLPIGFLFIMVFRLMSTVIRSMGITITSVASKMSVIIPVVAGIILYDEKLNAIKIGGILLALVAVVLTNIHHEDSPHAKRTVAQIIMLVLYFAGSGLVDTSIKFAQARLMTPSTEQLYIVAIFCSAGFWGVLELMYDSYKKNNQATWRSFGGGIMLGSINYISLFFVIKALQQPGAQSSITYPVINIGVLILTAIAGMILYKEKFSMLNYFGLLLALISIPILSMQ